MDLKILSGTYSDLFLINNDNKIVIGIDSDGEVKDKRSYL